jgi:ribosomal protein S19
MPHRPESTGRELNLTRLAWLVSIVAPVVLIGLLCLLKAASATAAVNPAPELPAAPMVEDEEEGEESCFEWEVGVLECEEPESAAEEGPRPPEECLLRTAQARVVSSPSHNRLRFIVRYSMVVPTRAYLDFEVHNGDDSFALGIVRRHLGKSGVVRINESLGSGQMEKARSASDYLLTLDIPSTPSSCQPYFTRRLSQKRTLHGQTVWLQSDPAAGPVE